MDVYKLKNLDCADCAVGIENHIKKLDDVKFVSVNFATSKLYIDTDNIEKVKKEIKKVEREVDVEILDNGIKEINGKGERSKSSIKNKFQFSSVQKRMLLILSFSAIIYIVGIILKPKVHSTSLEYIEYIVFLIPYFLTGWNIILSAGKNIVRGRVFDENFLMTVATMGAIAIHQLPEAVGVMIFYKIGEFFQDLSVDHSRRSIKELLEIKSDYANLKKGREIKRVDPQNVIVGETIVVNPGEKIPLDGKVTDGYTQIDTSALTGESVPRIVKAGEEVLAGMINKTGVISVRVTKTFSESSISKILDLVENAASKKSATEKFITKFARFYSPVVVGVAIITAFLPPLLTGDALSVWVYRALILLVISCPCALVISIPLGYFGGIGGGARRGILIKGSNYLDILDRVKTVVFDKTGTLTKGVFKVTEIYPADGSTKEELLYYAALAESHSNHPIAKSILEAYGKKGLNDVNIVRYREIPGHGIVVEIGKKTVVVGNDRLLHLKNIEHDRCINEGTTVNVAVNGRYLGYIIISDELKDDVDRIVPFLSKLGIDRIIMLTGDSKDVSKSIAERLGIDEYYSELLPEDKVSVLETVMKRSDNGKVTFVGDGINDAPVIARADVGIAMGGLGSDAAIETADIVIMTDKPSKVAEAIKMGRKTRRIVWQNIIFALIVKLIFISLGVVGLATIWEAVFADVGVALIAVFNALRALR